MLDLQNYLNNLANELERANEKHPVGFHSAHEGYAVILEELDEAWDEIKSNNIVGARAEMVQVGAMVLRFLLDTEKLV